MDTPTPTLPELPQNKEEPLLPRVAPAPTFSPSPLKELKEKPPARSGYGSTFIGAFVKTVAVMLGISLVVFGIIAVTSMSEVKSCNVAVHTLHGELTTYPMGLGDETDSASLARAIQNDDNDARIHAIMIDIDSPGGLPVAGEEVATALQSAKKPTVAVIKSTGASAAYWASLGADAIFASKNSDVGSIGVIVSFPDESEKNKKDGVAYNELITGKFKNIGTPNRPATEDEKALLQRDINEIFENFVGEVATARHLSLEEVHALADGSSMTGARAKEMGLIDAIGGTEDARVYLENQIGKTATLCDPDGGSFFY
jgi:protease-4